MTIVYNDITVQFSAGWWIASKLYGTFPPATIPIQSELLILTHDKLVQDTLLSITDRIMANCLYARYYFFDCFIGRKSN